METEMRFILRVPLLLMMFSLLANAQEQSIQKQNVQEQNIQEQNIQVGHGVLCDTVRQVERFVSLRDNGKDVRGALQTVNDEAQNAAACNLALFMFAPGKPIAELTIKGRLMSIVEITVYAFGNQRIWQKVPAMTRYTVVVEKGVVI